MEGVPLLDTYNWSFDTFFKIYCQLGSFFMFAPLQWRRVGSILQTKNMHY